MDKKVLTRALVAAVVGGIIGYVLSSCGSGG